jgi:hypothetical protein
MGRPSIYMRSCWEGRVARTLLAALPFKVEEAYFFEQNCQMTFSRNMMHGAASAIGLVSTPSGVEGHSMG